MTELSTQDFYDADDGFNLFTFSTPQRLLYEIQHPNASNIWNYTARTAPYRLTDFESYNHYAPALCSLTFVGNNSGAVNTTLRLECTDVDNMIAHWAYFAGVRSYVDFVYLIYEQGTEYNQSGTQSVYVLKVTSMVDYEGDNIFRLKIPSLLSAGNYECRLCCSTATTGMTDGECIHYNPNSGTPLVGTWYALPQHCKQTFTVTSGGGGGGGTTDYYNYLDINFYNASYNFNPGNYSLSDISFTNYIVIGTASNKTFNLYIEYWYDNAASPVKLATVSRTLNEEDIPWATINVNYNGSITTMTEADLENKITVRAECILTVDNVGYPKTIRATIERV